MSLLALREAEGRRGLANVFVTRDTAVDGRYECRLYSSAAGCWRRVVIDDRLPAKRRGGQPELIFASSKGKDELWMSLLEKAYAKKEGSFDAIDGGFVHVGLVDLTGG